MSSAAIDMKTCNKCREAKPLTEFRKHAGTKDKLTTYCKSCLYALARGWRNNNKIHVTDWFASYRQKNKQQLNTNQKKWRENNKGKKNADTALRFAVKMQRTPKWLTKEQKQSIKEFYVMAKELEKIFPWKQHVDHIVPLQGADVCGLHVPWNLQILSAKENITKGNRYNG